MPLTPYLQESILRRGVVGKHALCALGAGLSADATCLSLRDLSVSSTTLARFRWFVMKQGKIFWFKSDVLTPDSIPRGVIDVRPRAWGCRVTALEP